MERRMFIDAMPPDDPQDGDVWIARGTLRKYHAGWDPPYDPPPPPPEPPPFELTDEEVLAIYPKRGRRSRKQDEKQDQSNG